LKGWRDAGRLGVVLSGGVAGACCCRVLLPHLSPVVIDRVDGKVVIAAHPVLSPRKICSKVVCKDGPNTELVSGVCDWQRDPGRRRSPSHSA
jgi:hypothetical protein